MATHRFHGLSHSCPAVRHRMKQWIIDMMDLALAMGTRAVGGHWDALSIEVLSAPTRTQMAKRTLYETFRELAQVGKSKGMAAIYQEQMYIPSELPWTLDGAEEFLVETNRDNDGIPVLLTVDVGHQAGQTYGMCGADLDHLEWLRRYGAVSETIHIQQTQPEGSHHWPFTEQYNKVGHIKIDKVIEAIRHSHEHFGESPLAKVMKPLDRQYLTLEVIPGSTKCEDVLLRELKESAEYLPVCAGRGSSVECLVSSVGGRNGGVQSIEEHGQVQLLVFGLLAQRTVLRVPALSSEHEPVAGVRVSG